MSGIPLKKTLIISGPCSAETEEQVMLTARAIAATKRVDIFRAGIWKPNTGMFEGAGTKALEWLANVARETGLPVATEVASADHVQQALQNGIDILWLGAYTTVNPFSVQEIATALRGTGVTVFVKNPVNPEVELWSGAVERLQNAGIEKIGLIHRGFSSYGNTEYQNAPMWHLPIEMKRRHPALPLLCDPSHICSTTEMIPRVAQESIDLDFDGLMIESHIDPGNTCSDAKLQVTPQRLNEILASLTARTRAANIPEPALASLREKIDQTDDELLALLSIRMKISDAVGIYKKKNNLAILQTGRWNEMLEKAYQKGSSLSLSREFLEKYFAAVHMESISHQNRIIDGL